MAAPAQQDLTPDPHREFLERGGVHDDVVVAKTAGEVAAAAGAGDEPLVGRRPGDEREHELSSDCWCGPTVEAVPPAGTVRLDERDVAADLGAIDPAAVPSVDRADGRPGFVEQYAGARLSGVDEGASPTGPFGLAALTDPPPVNETLRTPPPRRNPTSSRILTEADRIIHGERAQSYGSAEESFARIGKLWTAYLGVDVDAYDVAMLMTLLKVSRAKTDLKDDTFVDIAGYAALAPRCATAAGRTGA